MPASLSATADWDRLFAIDWLPATDATADWSIEGYVALLDEAVQFLGGRRLPNVYGCTRA